ncbi:2OG-Fe(II) oxygenase [Andreprevotia chitinilytica]|uniref:2OG-Fe(II) oxygenase n=1 Tax=Andreprevotia chitinilytica TaxID=396808 RepID=UPI00055365C8|nr:2OG-Fe(II) oxygenase [Andreprevotia chitinilytica]
MSQVTQLTPEWQHWIQDNLGRGCTPQSLIEIMVSQNFDPMFANAIVFHLTTSGQQPVVDRPQAGAPTATQRTASTGYTYETPRVPAVGNAFLLGDREVRVAARIEKPYIIVFDGVLSHEECDELIELSRHKLERSMVVDPTTGSDALIADRTSHGTFFALNENDFIAKLDARISAVMHCPVENGEGIQILNYQTSGEYKPHFDYFPPTDPGSKRHLANGGQRVSTMVMYLNDVEEGGETVFPEIGMTVAPKKGSAVYFEYYNSLDQVDPLTLHGGKPVTKGEKWIATKWMRQRRFG